MCAPRAARWFLARSKRELPADSAQNGYLINPKPLPGAHEYICVCANVLRLILEGKEKAKHFGEQQLTFWSIAMSAVEN